MFLDSTFAKKNSSPLAEYKYNCNIPKKNMRC